MKGMHRVSREEWLAALHDYGNEHITQHYTAICEPPQLMVFDKRLCPPNEAPSEAIIARRRDDWMDIETGELDRENSGKFFQYWLRDDKFPKD